MRHLIFIALAGMLIAQVGEAETTSFTSNSVEVNYDAADLLPMQTVRGSTASFYSNYIDYPLTQWAKGRTATYIQAVQDGTQFVTPPIAIPPGSTIAYEVDYALWFPLYSSTVSTFYNLSAPYFFTISMEGLSGCSTLATEVTSAVEFRRVYASEIFASKNQLAPYDKLAGIEKAIVDKFKPVNPGEYASNTAAGLKDEAVSFESRNKEQGFTCSRLRIVFPHRLEVAVYGVKVTIRN